MTIRARSFWALIACVAFAYCAWRVWQFVRQYRAQEIVDWLGALPATNLMLAAAFAAASYITLTGYDTIAVRYAGERLAYKKVAVASFVSLAVGYPLGPAPLGTGVLRYFYYTRLGVGLEGFVKLALLIMVTSVMGKFSFTSLILLYDAAPAAGWFGLDESILKAASVISLIGIALYAMACLRWRRNVRIGAWSFALPSVRIALAQMALGT
ncbi:MAG TPA: YbhN family protein, partial [Xanthobacteraceae bacterium]|nr:YbhN family protein [Xanthobacteraceae bacterium]